MDRADLRAQIEARIVERRSVAPLVGDSEVRRGTKRPRSRTSAGPRHRKPPRAVFLPQLLIFVVLTALVVVGLRSFVVASFYIPSASMETTLHGCTGCEPDLVMVDKLSYRFGHPSRGDVVVFNRPPGAPAADKQLIKRVIGLPGETISGHDGKVWIGSRALTEPYVDKVCLAPASGNFAPIVVPAGDYFMMGDNRCDSADSRVFGPIPGSSMVGRAFAVIWPVKHLRWL